MHRRLLLTALSAFTVLVSLPASAWKLETHIWQARMIWSEASAGAVRVRPGEERPVPAYVRDSLKNNQYAFLMGVLGPDVYPDMVAGQMTTHPGLIDEDPPAAVQGFLQTLGRPVNLARMEPRWKTDDWLKWVRDGTLVAAPPPKVSAETAFAYGYTLHAAMDMWAHTYVNTYTGGVFNILKNQEIPARHIALESYIKHRHPDLLTMAPLQSSADAQRELSRIVANPVRLLTKPTGAGPAWFNEMRAPTEFVRRRLILNSRVADQYARVPSTQHLFAMYTYWAEVKRLNDNFSDIRKSIDRTIDNATRSVTDAEGAWRTAQGIYNAAVYATDAAYDAVRNAEREVTRTADNVTKAAKPIIDMLGSAADSVVSRAPDFLRKPYEDAKRAARDAEDRRADARATYDRLKRDRDTKQSQMDAALRAVNLRKEARNALAVAFAARVPVIDGAIGEWVRSLERAVDAYVMAWEDTAKETMRPKGNRFQAGGDPMAPLKDWLLCYGPTFGLPAIPGAYPAACGEAVRQYKLATGRLEELAVNTVIPKEIRDVIIRFDDEISRVGSELLVATGKLVSNTLRIDPNGEVGGYARSVVTVSDKDSPTPQALDDEFDDDASGEGLPKFIPPNGLSVAVSKDIAGSPVTDTALTGLTRFAVLQNSMTMSRLALLDGNGLNGLIRARISPLALQTLPYSDSEYSGAVLLGAVASIDGDHQWQPTAPALPGMRGIESRPFGYSPETPSKTGSKTGMRLWNIVRVRECVWNAIMAGPLSPGLLEQHPGLVAAFQRNNNSYPSVAKPVDAPAPNCGQPPQQRPITTQPLRPLGG